MPKIVTAEPEVMLMVRHSRDQDVQREARIDAARRELQAATFREEKYAAWRRMKAEIVGRSPEQVRRLEIAKGLT